MSYTFIRWFRQGMAAALDGGLLQQPPQGARAKLPVAIELSATGVSSNPIASASIEMLGPGDVSGVDPRQVVRCLPVDGTPDFEAGHFAHVEFRRPDLPWMFSPVAPNTAADSVPMGWTRGPYLKQHTVMPWLCLAVIPRRDGVKVERASPMPRLTIADGAGAELPLLDEVHAWAHVQVSGALDKDVATIAAQQRERVVSRLVCPRRLASRTHYIACVLPVFKSGCQAGLGQDVTVGRPDELAWSASDATVELPVYFHWEFDTADDVDFKALVLRLVPLQQVPGAGARPLDITSPGFSLTDRTAQTLVDLGGALCVDAPASAPIDAQFAADVAPVISAADAVAPPIYGRWHAAVDRVTPPAGATGWVEALNLDPRYRVAAGLGTQVVQDRQEDLMAAIWQQFGEIVRANQLLRQAQLAVAASERVVARHFTRLFDIELIALVGPAIGRLRVGPHRTARRAIGESCLPTFAVSGAFRRILRGRGPIARRFARLVRGPLPDVPTLDAPVLSARGVLDRLARGQDRLAPARLPDGGIVAPFDVSSRTRPRTPEENIRGPRIPAEIRTALAALQRRVPRGTCTPLDEAGLATSIRGAIAPDVAITARVRAQLALPAGIQISARLDPIMVAPEIPTPMIGPLQDRGQDWLLPGLDDLPRNSVVIVKPDAPFIEAYMVGLNHEIGREMLWRGFPTDQRGTVFARFWDRRGSVSSAVAPVPDQDIQPIHGWDKTEALGAHLTESGRDFLVLLIRGDLIQRYPLATVYLQRARWVRNMLGIIETQDGLALREPVPVPDDPTAWGDDVQFPSFRGQLGGDIAFLGFPLSPEEVRGRSRVDVPWRHSGNPGWYVTFQEQPTEPRFGLEKGGTAPPASWNEIGWDQFALTGPTGYVKLAETSTTQRFSELGLQPTWDGRSDSMAAIVMKRAFRLFVHASDLVAGS
jgi:hypothetical protein